MSDMYHSQDFLEFLLRHLYLSPIVFRKAKALGLTGDDFLPEGEFELPLYKILANYSLKGVETSPISIELLTMLIQMDYQDGKLDINIASQALATVGKIYTSNSPLMEEYVATQLVDFIKVRRSAKILASAAGDISRIHDEYSKVIFPLEALDNSESPIEDRFVNPFKTVIKKSKIDLIPTGFPNLNSALGGGIGYREMGLIVGFPGSGKTAWGVNIARGAALMGYKTIYCSMEEEKEDIANRLYSTVFRIDYTSLHSGSGYMELDQKMGDPDIYLKLEDLRNNLQILDLKGITPMTARSLKQIVDDYAEKNNFIYKLLIIDQLQFMEPESRGKDEQEWQREGRTVAEIDAMTHEPVGGTTNEYFAAWVLHQAKGKVKINFTNDEISGFKGIIHKPETVIGVGRENPTSNNFELFSLKSRHSKNFRLPMEGDLQYMTFKDKDDAPGAAHDVAAAAPAPCIQTMMTSNNYGSQALSQILAASSAVTKA